MLLKEDLSHIMELHLTASVVGGSNAMY